MGPRQNAHYEEAFRRYLAERRVPFVTVEQMVRRADGLGPIKNFDVLVHAPNGAHYIVEVKGKQFPNRSRKREVFWENWVHLEDVEGLQAWEEHFGAGYTGLLVYVYWVQTTSAEAEKGRLYRWGERDYLMVGITAGEFAGHCRTRSIRWQALYIPVREFLGLIQPVDKLMGVG